MPYLLLAFFLLMVHPSWGAIAYDTSCNGEAEAGAGAACNITFGASANIAIVCLSMREGGSAVQPATAVSVGGNAATFLVGVNNANGLMRAEIWYYLSPAAGLTSVTSTMDATTDRNQIGVVSFSGVAQTSTFNTTGTNQATSTNMDVDSLASALTEVAVLCGSARRGTAATTAAADATSPVSTERIDEAHSQATSGSIMVYTEDGAASTINMRVDLSESVQWAAVAVSMRALASATRRPVTPLMMQ